MIVLNRHAEANLENWKIKKNRKPLIVRGARQVGKTTLIKKFASSFKFKIMLNLEFKADRILFEESKDVHSLLEIIFLKNGLLLDNLGETLLFIDEIQESPEAISILRYFYEEVDELFVIAAGSLLEFALKDIRQFPVGRVEFLYLYPLNFMEYLDARGFAELKDKFNEVPVPKIAHDIILEEFNQFVIIGGMPEVLCKYLEVGHMTNLAEIYESIWSTYKLDIEKYASGPAQKNVLKHIMEVAPLSLDKRIKFNNFGKSNYKSREVGEAMRILDTAKVLRLIYPSTSLTPPIIPDLKKSPRLQFLDTGIVNYSLGIQADMIGLEDLTNEYRGAIIPHMITQELLSLNSIKDSNINFWVRESNKSTAEVDLIFSYKNKLIPIEIKSGKTGTLKSLHLFIDACDHPYAVRLYAGEFSIDEHTTPKGTPYYLMNLPYYCATKIYEYLDYFVTEEWKEA